MIRVEQFADKFYYIVNTNEEYFLETGVFEDKILEIKKFSSDEDALNYFLERIEPNYLEQHNREPQYSICYSKLNSL